MNKVFLFFGLGLLFLPICIGDMMSCGETIDRGRAKSQTFEPNNDATGVCRDERGVSCRNVWINQVAQALACDDNLEGFCACCQSKPTNKACRNMDIPLLRSPPTTGYQIFCGIQIATGTLSNNWPITEQCGKKLGMDCSTSSCILQKSKDIPKFGKCCVKEGQGFYVRFLK